MHRTLAMIFGGLLAVLLLVALSLYAFRDSVATHGLAAMLDRQEPNVRCNRPQVSVAASLQRLTLGPLSCNMRAGPLASYETESDISVELDGLDIASFETQRATLDQRERDVSHVEYNTLGDLANLTGAMDAFVKGVLDAAEQYGEPGPTIGVDVLTTKRGGKKESVQYGFVQSRDGEWDRTRVARAVESGPELVRVRDMDMRVTSKRGLYTANLYFSDPDPGEAPDARLEIEGKQLDQKKPQFRMSLEDAPERTARARKQREH